MWPCLSPLPAVCRYLAQSWALFLTPASRASLLSTFTVIAVPCLAGLSGERVKPLVWACGLAALVGTTLLEQGGGEPPNAGGLLVSQQLVLGLWGQDHHAFASIYVGVCMAPISCADLSVLALNRKQAVELVVLSQVSCNATKCPATKHVSVLTHTPD